MIEITSHRHRISGCHAMARTLEGLVADNNSSSNNNNNKNNSNNTKWILMFDFDRTLTNGSNGSNNSCNAAAAALGAVAPPPLCRGQQQQQQQNQPPQDDDHHNDEYSGIRGGERTVRALRDCKASLGEDRCEMYIVTARVPRPESVRQVLRGLQREQGALSEFWRDDIDRMNGNGDHNNRDGDDSITTCCVATAMTHRNLLCMAHSSRVYAVGHYKGQAVQEILQSIIEKEEQEEDEEEQQKRIQQQQQGDNNNEDDDDDDLGDDNDKDTTVHYKVYFFDDAVPNAYGVDECMNTWARAAAQQQQQQRQRQQQRRETATKDATDDDSNGKEKKRTKKIRLEVHSYWWDCLEEQISITTTTTTSASTTTATAQATTTTTTLSKSPTSTAEALSSSTPCKQQQQQATTKTTTMGLHSPNGSEFSYQLQYGRYLEAFGIDENVRASVERRYRQQWKIQMAQKQQSRRRLVHLLG